jgi:hypothetical protein
LPTQIPTLPEALFSSLQPNLPSILSLVPSNHLPVSHACSLRSTFFESQTHDEMMHCHMPCLCHWSTKWVIGTGVATLLDEEPGIVCPSDYVLAPCATLVRHIDEAMTGASALRTPLEGCSPTLSYQTHAGRQHRMPVLQCRMSESCSPTKC